MWLSGWMKRIPLIEEQAQKLWDAGIRTQNSGQLAPAISAMLEEREDITIGITGVCDGLRAIYDHLSSNAQRMYARKYRHRLALEDVNKTPERDETPLEIARRVEGNYPASGPEPPTQLPLVSEGAVTAEGLAEALLAKLDTLRLRIHALESENMVQADLLNESANQINMLQDRIKELQYKRSDLTQRLAASVAGVVGGD